MLGRPYGPMQSSSCANWLLSKVVLEQSGSCAKWFLCKVVPVESVSCGKWFLCKVASVQRSSRAKLFLCKVIPVQSGSCARWFLCKVVLLHKRCCSKSLLVLCHKCPIVKRFMGEDDCANTHLRHFCKKLSLHRGKSGSCGKWFLCVKDAVQRVS